jgi:hypothetical protein
MLKALKTTRLNSKGCNEDMCNIRHLLTMTRIELDLLKELSATHKQKESALGKDLLKAKLEVNGVRLEKARRA